MKFSSHAPTPFFFGSSPISLSAGGSKEVFSEFKEVFLMGTSEGGIATGQDLLSASLANQKARDQCYLPQ